MAARSPKCIGHTAEQQGYSCTSSLKGLYSAKQAGCGLVLAQTMKQYFMTATALVLGFKQTCTGRFVGVTGACEGQWHHTGTNRYNAAILFAAKGINKFGWARGHSAGSPRGRIGRYIRIGPEFLQSASQYACMQRSHDDMVYGGLSLCAVVWNADQARLHELLD